MEKPNALRVSRTSRIPPTWGNRIAITAGVLLSTDEQDIIQTIERIFAAVGDDDRASLDKALCEDFHAFENGIQMTGRELLDLMSKSRADGKRYRWSVTEAQVEVQGDLGVMVYVNQGSIADSLGASPTPMSWLETVLLRRDQSGWRLAFLHSTRTQGTSPSAAQ
jgi:ketosteroid isomerase-like protein